MGAPRDLGAREDDWTCDFALVHHAQPGPLEDGRQLAGLGQRARVCGRIAWRRRRHQRSDGRKQIGQDLAPLRRSPRGDDDPPAGPHDPSELAHGGGHVHRVENTVDGSHRVEAGVGERQRFEIAFSHLGRRHALAYDGQQGRRGVESGDLSAAETGQQREETRAAAGVEQARTGGHMGGVERCSLERQTYLLSVCRPVRACVPQSWP
jgi:hypothetical protein